MAMQQITKKCPYCGNVYARRAVGAMGRAVQEEDQWLYGSPMKLCESCKKIFIDKDVKELAITPLRKSDTAKITQGTLRLMPFGAAAVVLLLILQQSSFAIVAGLVTLTYLAADLCMYPMRMKKLDKEREASEKRLSDPEYARILRDAGISIPKEYLKA